MKFGCTLPSFIIKHRGQTAYLKRILPVAGGAGRLLAAPPLVTAPLCSLYVGPLSRKLSTLPKMQEVGKADTATENEPLIHLASRKVVLSKPQLLKLRRVDNVLALGSIKQNEFALGEQYFIRKFELRKTIEHLLALSKIRLTGLVVVTTIAGYAMAPTASLNFSLASVIVGTILTSASANSLNQFLEIPYDSQMNRTKNRVLVRGYMSPLAAVCFAGAAGVAGVATLVVGCGVWTAGLATLNLLLYAGVYTPLKRRHIVNTWVGSVVGAIPPVMGWTAASGGFEPGALLLGALLYSWQFPHFNALSWNLRPDYSRAGYRMMSVTNPDLCRLVALRHSFIITAVCLASPLTDVVTWTFALSSLPINLYLLWYAREFYRRADSHSSRKLFRLSLIHLPTVIILMLFARKDSAKQSSLTLVPAAAAAPPGLPDAGVQRE